MKQIHKTDCILGLFYDAYLKEVIAVLEKDEEFRNKMANVNFEDVKVATFSKELNTVAKHVRDELDTLKRKEIDRIRKLLKGKFFEKMSVSEFWATRSLK